jgi:hypothetical protein
LEAVNLQEQSQTIGINKKKWGVCFENTILELDLSIYEKMVYIVLCAHAQKDGPTSPCVKTIAEELSCSKTKVFEVLNRLEKIGIITRNHQSSMNSMTLNPIPDNSSIPDFLQGDKERDGGEER